MSKFGTPIKTLPDVNTANAGRPPSPFWEEVAKHVADHEGNWIPISHELKIPSAQVAANIRRGRVASLRGYDAASRSGKLYVALNPES